MNSLIIYSIELSAGLAIFYLTYYLFFQKDTHFKLKRWYLITSLLISFIIPKIDFNYKTDISNNFLSENIFIPIAKYKQKINSKLKVLTKADPDIFQNKINMLSDLKTKQQFSEYNEKNKTLINHKKSNTLKIIPKFITFNSSSNLNLNTILFITYLAGLIFFLIRFALNISYIIKHALQGKIEKVNCALIIWIKKEIPPFSFLNYIFISANDKTKKELTNIILHEKIHISQKHSFDIIIIELLLIFQWFNPFMWLYKKAVKRNHEFLADIGVINNGIEIPNYQYSLLNYFLVNKKFDIVSNYSYNDLKVRIAMLTKKRSSRLSIMKFLLIMPSIIFLCLAFSFNISIQSVNNDNVAGYKNTISAIFNLINNTISVHSSSHFKPDIGENKKNIIFKTKKTTFHNINEPVNCTKTELCDNNIQGICCSVLDTRNGLTYILNDSIPYTGQCYSNYETGEKGLTGSYVNGIESGKWIFWYKNGQKKMEYQEVNGQKNGSYYAWYKNGKLRIDARFNMGEIDELYKCWYENGNLKKESCFNNGVPYDSSVFDENGYPDILL